MESKAVKLFEDEERHSMENGMVIYQDSAGDTRVSVRFADKDLWLTQLQLAEIYNTSKQNISHHIDAILKEGELSDGATVKYYLTVQKEGKREVKRKIAHYNLDMVIALGYRVKSPVATRFRRWATEHLHEYIQKGFVLDDERLKSVAGGDYWKELLDRIRDIRSSEKMLYRQVLELYATAIDYDPACAQTLEFFKIVQNKLHYAAHGHTAAEVIYERADAEKPFMGLTSFSGEMPEKKDVGVAKNYLSEEELKVLNNLVSGYFDIAEINAIEHKPMYMKDYISQLDTILASGGRGLLKDAGSVSRAQALGKAEAEYQKFRQENLSPVEKRYLDTLKQTQKSLKGKR